MPPTRKQLLLLLTLQMKRKRRRKNFNRMITNSLLMVSEIFRTELAMHMNVVMATNAQLALLLPSPRQCWVYPREDSWFTGMWENRFDETYHGGHRWKKDFRMSIDTFLNLVHRLTPLLQKQDTVRFTQYSIFYIFFSGKGE